MTHALQEIAFPTVTSLPDVTFRHPRLPDDWAPLAELVTACRLADGVEEVSTAEYLAADWGNADGLDPTRDFLLAERDGRLVGCVCTWPTLRDDVLALESWGCVHPAFRRQRLGTALHHWGRAHNAARAAVDPRAGERQFRTYALDIETSDQALFDAEGYVRIRFGFEMRRALTGALPDHPLPAGLEIRPVRDEDVRTIMRGEDEAFRDHWGHRDQTEADIRSVLDHPETDVALWLVAWDGAEVAGVVANTIYRVENERLGLARGWLDRVSVRRPWRGRGLAKALCVRSFELLRDQGMDEAWLGVDAANPTGALHLYEGLGFVVARRWYAYARPLDGPAPADWPSASTSAPVDPHQAA
jgi:GNAT superfamily N-acetyltransferase